MIAYSEGEKQKRINEAEGRAVEIEKVALATAKGIRKIAESHQRQGRPRRRQPANRRAVPRRVRQARQDQQLHDHPIESGRHRRHDQGRHVGNPAPGRRPLPLRGKTQEQQLIRIMIDSCVDGVVPWFCSGQTLNVAWPVGATPRGCPHPFGQARGPAPTGARNPARLGTGSSPLFQAPP